MKSAALRFKGLYYRMCLWHAHRLCSWAWEIGFWVPIAAIYLKDAFVI